MRLQPHDVYARGLVFSRCMPLLDIVEIEGGYSGLTFVLRDGLSFEATGVGEKFNITTWLGRTGKADSIADTIREAPERAIAGAPDAQRQSMEPVTPPASPPPAYVKWATGVGTAAFLFGAFLAFISDTWTDAGLPFMAFGAFGPVLLMLWTQKRS